MSKLVFSTDEMKYTSKEEGLKLFYVKSERTNFKVDTQLPIVNIGKQSVTSFTMKYLGEQ